MNENYKKISYISIENKKNLGKYRGFNLYKTLKIMRLVLQIRKICCLLSF